MSRVPRRIWRRLSRGQVALAGAGMLVIVLLIAWGVGGTLRIWAMRQEISAVERDIATLRARAAVNRLGQGRRATISPTSRSSPVRSTASSARATPS